MNLDAIFDVTRVQISIQAPNYQILWVNRTVIENNQTTCKELIGRKCYEAYYQRALPCERCPIAVTIRTHQPSFSIMKIPDVDTTFRIFSYPVLDEKANLVFVIEYVQDITEEQHFQEQILQSEKLAEMGILASSVAHEINNPLSGIIGMAEIALEEKDVSKNKNYLKDIMNCAQRISEIVRTLKAYSRATKKGEKSLVDIHEVLEDSLKMVRLGIRTNPVEVIKEFQPIEKIKANICEIEQVFVNLITNAFQAINGKGGKLVLSTRSLKDLVEVKVSDDGIGIPQKCLKKIFDPFFTTKKPGEGTGLGLNIVSRIVNKYEGTIDVKSREGVGTTFTVRFPIRGG